MTQVPPDDDDAQTILPTRRNDSSSASSGPRLIGFLLQPGRKLGARYTIIKLLGRGGMGAVYQAWDDELQVAVAIKTILPDADADEHATHAAEERFKRELLLARQVTHKNVVRIHDLGEVDGQKYITMSYVEGETLGQLIRRNGPLPVPKAVGYAKQIADGLAAAHEVGIVHRDLKPENVMITPDGHAVIMDFGIARGGGGSTETQAGTIIGTLEYMAPEQASGLPVDQRADIYAFGLIVYDMLLGRQRTKGRDSAMTDMLQRAQRAPAAPTTTRVDVPPDFEQVVMQCLQPDAKARPQTTNELVELLARLAPDGYRRVEHTRIGRREMIGLAVGVALFVALAIGGTWFMTRGGPAGVEARPPMSLLIANFENRANDPVFDGLLEQALGVGIESAAFINTMPRRDAVRAAAALPGATLTAQNARLIAIREGVNVVLTGSIDPDQSGYRLRVRALAGPTTDERQLFEAEERAASKDDVLGAVGRLAAEVRNRLGDRDANSSNVSVEQTFTAKSLEAVRAYATGQDMHFQGKFDVALANYAIAVQLDPEFGRAWAARAAAANNLGRRDEAAEHYKQALRFTNQMTEREKFHIRGAYHLFAGNGDQATAEFEALLKQFPGDPVGISNLAFGYFQKREFARAIQVGKVGADLFPGNALRRNNVALYAMYAGDFETARTMAEEVLKINPRYLNAFVAIALSETATGQFDAARATYQKLQETSPAGKLRGTFGMADLALLRGRPAEAVAALEPAIAEETSAGSRARLEVTLAEARAAAGAPAASIKLAENAAATGRDASIQFLAGRLLAQAGRTASASAIATGLTARLDAESQMAGLALEGEILLARNDARAAVARFQNAIKAADAWLARYGLGRAYLAANAFAEADAEFDRLLKRRGEATAVFLDDIPTWRAIAPVYYYQGLARAGLGSAGAAESFKTFLAFKEGGDEQSALVTDARTRLR
jgi:serine/threonine-protein kinase